MVPNIDIVINISINLIIVINFSFGIFKQLVNYVALQYIRWQKCLARCKKISCEDILLTFPGGHFHAAVLKKSSLRDRSKNQHSNNVYVKVLW